MLVIAKRKPEDPELVIYQLYSAAIPNYERDLKEDPMPIYKAGWDGFALIKNGASGQYELRVYTEAAWERDWCHIFNREYGEILASGSCWRETWNGKEYVVPEPVARQIYDQIHKDNIIQDLENRIEDLYDWIEPQFQEAGLTQEGLLEDQQLMGRLVELVEDNQDSNVAYNTTLENSVRQLLTELVQEKGGAQG